MKENKKNKQNLTEGVVTGDLPNPLPPEVYSYSEESIVSTGLTVAVKKLDPNAVIPSYANTGDAGMDLSAVSINDTQDYIEYGTGLALAIPEGFVGLVFPRSSISKYHLTLANSVGVIDSHYRGEVKLRFKRKGHEIYKVGDRVGQIIILPYPEVSFVEGELDKTQRGTSGFGSTGK